MKRKLIKHTEEELHNFIEFLYDYSRFNENNDLSLSSVVMGAWSGFAQNRKDNNKTQKEEKKKTRTEELKEIEEYIMSDYDPYSKESRIDTSDNKPQG